MANEKENEEKISAVDQPASQPAQDTNTKNENCRHQNRLKNWIKRLPLIRHYIRLEAKLDQGLKLTHELEDFVRKQNESSSLAAMFKETLATNQNALSSDLGKILRLQNELKKYEMELLWSQIFDDTISSSTWLNDRNLSLGRWAIGYPAAYILYRVLDEVKPKHILELGLGQSTKFTGQYALANSDVEHIVFEHDANWINFFARNYTLPENTKIIQRPWEYVNWKGVANVRRFQGFNDAIGNRKFDLIVIDAPLGGDMKQYARVDVLSAMPDCLAESFVILFDDCNRSGEQHTYNDMIQLLKDKGVPFKDGNYSGQKIMNIISSSELGFLASL